MALIIQNDLGYVDVLTYQDEDMIITPQNSNSSEDNRVIYINYLKSLIRVKNTGKPLPGDMVYDNLRKEMPALEGLEYGSASRLFEFIPVMLRAKSDISNKIIEIKLRGKINSESGIRMTLDKFKDLFLKFANVIKITHNEYIIQTTLRTCINANIPYSYIPYNSPEEVVAFKSIILQAPYFILSKLLEHTQLSKEIEYDKNIKDELYWFPENFSQDEINNIPNLTYGEISELIKNKNLSRDVSSAGLYGWRKRKMIISGWESKYTWKRLLLDKNALTNEHINFTIKEISTVVKAIKEILYPIF